MRKRSLLAEFVLSVIVCLCTVSCAASVVTETVFGPPATTFTRIFTVAGDTGAALPVSVPQTPHPLQKLNFSMCFSCHPIPPGHTGRLAVEAVCTECHIQAPEWNEN